MDFLNRYIGIHCSWPCWKDLCEYNLKSRYPCSFRGKNVGDFRGDMVVNGCVLLELKTADGTAIAHEAQLLNYLRATSLEVGLILNFGPKPLVRRLVYDNSRKRFKSQTAGAPQ